jgi:DNA-directed RNA polymerase subunit RPC12/RpoP
MSDIKFACPHCRQHVACDSAYGDLRIECPSCGLPLMVPRLSAADSSHPATVLVASPPSPKRALPPPIPILRPWTEEEWEARGRDGRTGALPVLNALMWIVVGLVGIPLIGLAVLFAGCAACGRNF